MCVGTPELCGRVHHVHALSTDSAPALAPTRTARSRKDTHTRTPPARVCEADTVAVTRSMPQRVKGAEAVSVAPSAPSYCRNSPAPSPCSPVAFPSTRFGGAWDEPADASTIGHASRWAHPDLQRWVASAGGTREHEDTMEVRVRSLAGKRDRRKIHRALSSFLDAAPQVIPCLLEQGAEGRALCEPVLFLSSL